MIRAVPIGVAPLPPDALAENSREFEKNASTPRDEWIRLPARAIERRHFARPRGAKPPARKIQMAVAASRAALEMAGLQASDIDAGDRGDIDARPDLPFPPRPWCRRGWAWRGGGFGFDVQAVCAGFVYALANANAPRDVGTGTARAGDRGRKPQPNFMDWTDRGTCVLFGWRGCADRRRRREGAGTPADRGIPVDRFWLPTGATADLL